MLWLGLTLLLASFLAASIAWRGRRIDDHPVCPKCGFDLHGIYPGAGSDPITCPECGRALSDSTVRTGNRRKRSKLLAGASAGLVASLLLLTFVLASSQTNWNRFKPTWWLFFEIESLGGDVATAAAEELHDRVVAQQITGRPVARLEQLAFDRRLAVTDPMRVDPIWATIAADAVASTRATPEQMVAYAEVLLGDPRTPIRDTYLDGETLAVPRPWLSDRTTRAETSYSTMRLLSLEVDGVPIEFGEGFLVTHAQSSGSRASSWRNSNGVQMPTADLAAGKHRIRTVWDVVAEPRAGGGGVSSGPPIDPGPGRLQREVVVEYEVAVVDSIASAIEMVTRDDGFTRPTIRVEEPSFPPRPRNIPEGAILVRVMLGYEGLEGPPDASVPKISGYIRLADGVPGALHGYRVGQPPETMLPPAPSAHLVTMIYEPDGQPPETIDLVLEPDPERLLRNSSFRSIWAEPISIPNVPLPSPEAEGEAP